MPEIVLCEGMPRVSIDGVSERILLVIKDGTSIRFWMAADRLKEAVAGDTLQVSADDGYLQIEGLGEIVRFEFCLPGTSIANREVPRSDVEAAIEIVREEILRDIPNPRVRVEEA